jgi:hypothetical protein
MEATWNNGNIPDNPVKQHSTININAGDKITEASGEHLEFNTTLSKV